MKRIGLVGLMGLLMTSCQEEAVEPEAATIEVRGFVSWFDEEVAKTRAWTIPSGYSVYNEEDNSIGICFTKNNETPKIDYFFKSSGKWRTNIEISSTEAETPFYLYGYAPHSAGISCSITDLDGANASYRTGAKLTLENVPTIMSGDLCVVVGATNGKDYYNGAADYEVPTLRRGTFSYEASAIVPGEGGAGNFVYLLFEHLYAGLTLNIRVNGTYAALRTIKLKDMYLQSNNDDTPVKGKTRIDVELTANGTGANPVTDVTFTPTGTSGNYSSIFHSAAGKEITTSYQSFTNHFMTKDVNKLILTSVYDIYDNAGNLIRKDCRATNTLDLTKLIDRFAEVGVKAGTKYNVNMTIQPTYLYMLSEPDLDNPDLVVG